jgi:hypothetical protein
MTLENDSNLTEPALQLLVDHAHRFDGYAWAQTQRDWNEDGPGYLAKQLYEPFKRTRRLPADSAATLALNFYLHRNFHHWGHLPGRDLVEWSEMILLYLHTYRMPTPQQFRHELAQAWEQRSKGAAEAAASEIRSLVIRGFFANK